jgi:hypothetical protein
MGNVNPHPPAAEPAYVPPPLHPYGAGGWEPEQPPRRPWRRTVLVAVVTALVIAALGALLGLLWHYLSPTVPVLDAGPNGIVVNDPSPEQYIAAEGWFTLLGLGFGLIVAVAAWMVLRRHRGPALLLGVTVGALAAAPVAWQLGRQIGLAAYERWRDTATSGATYNAPPDLHAHGTLLVPAFAAVIVMTLLAGWSNDPDLDRPGARPGYGNDLGHGPLPGYGARGSGPVSSAPVSSGPRSSGPVSSGPRSSGPRSSGPVSSGWPDAPDPTAEQAPPGPGPAVPPRD